MRINYLSLFSGAGGGDLAFQHLLKGFKCVGYVEYEEYCQKLIKQRIKDGLLDAAPIFGDIRKFISEGYAETYQGMVDLVTGGFPCQPFSVAGKQAREDDPRNMWPATCEVIKTVKPKYAFLENVPGLLVSGYFGTILQQLSDIGYNAKWLLLGANDVGALHQRQRIWFVVYANGIRFSCQPELSAEQHPFFSSKIQNQNQWENGEKSSRIRIKKHSITKTDKRIFKPDVLRVLDGVAHRVDRLKAIGNGQVPQVAATAWEILKP